jgi:hypothetical protein
MCCPESWAYSWIALAPWAWQPPKKGTYFVFSVYPVLDAQLEKAEPHPILRLSRSVRDPPLLTCLGNVKVLCVCVVLYLV